MSARVLIVDDIPTNVKLLEAQLSAEYFDVVTASNGAQALEICRRAECDIVLLDVMMPDMDGFEVCRRIKSNPNTHFIPVVLVTALDQPSDRLRGLEAGADDFLAKPFAVAELRARVRALGRRGPLTRPAVVRLGDVELDVAARRAVRDGRDVPITAREWAVLEMLASRAGRLASRAAILDAVWGDDSDAASASLDVIVGRIRRKLGASVVRTVRGEGYALGDGDT